MLQIDDQLLDRLGLNKDSGYREYMSNNLLSLLSLRVANKLTEQLSNDQIAEFDSQSDDAKEEWLALNVTDFASLVQTEMDETITEIQRTMPDVI